MEFEPVSIIRPSPVNTANFFDPLVTVLTGFHCISTKAFEHHNRAWCDEYWDYHLPPVVSMSHWSSAQSHPIIVYSFGYMPKEFQARNSEILKRNFCQGNVNIFQCLKRMQETCSTKECVKRFTPRIEQFMRPVLAKIPYNLTYIVTTLISNLTFVSCGSWRWWYRYGQRYPFPQRCLQVHIRFP